jgi:DNA ligase-1
MKFSKFANYLQKLESTTKRLEMTSILTDLIKDLPPSEIDKALYLASGYLKAPFESQKFNIAERMMLKVLESTYTSPSHPNIKEKIARLYQKNGDLGDVALALAENQKDTNMEISDVYEKLMEIAKIEGTGSQDLKTQKISSLLKTLNGLSAKYTIRIILGLTRLGYTELTIMDALAKLIGNKELRKEIEQRYSIHPDIGLIAKKIKEKGLGGLDDIKIETGVPVLSQKAQRVKDSKEAIERLGDVWAEFKFDGTRVQLHLDRSKKTKHGITTLFGAEGPSFLLKTFTRNLEETTHMYPDLVEAAKKQIKEESVILDGEAIGYNKETEEFLPFQEIMQRKRKYNIEAMAKEIPLKYFVFDILYLNGKSLIEKPLKERRKILDSVVKHGDTIIVDDHLETESSEELYEYFREAKGRNLEGLVVKKPDDSYQAGGRSYSWVKIKKADEKLLDDSVDLVILGYYFGKGIRSKFGVGGFLAGVYDDKTGTFKTISKIGTGLKEDDWIKLKLMCDKIKIEKAPANVEMNKIFKPNVFVSPKIVVEIGADEISVSPSHTVGYALRFPRLIKFRDDKSPKDATTLSEIKQMYKKQKRGNIKV